MQLNNNIVRSTEEILLKIIHDISVDFFFQLAELHLGFYAFVCFSTSWYWIFLERVPAFRRHKSHKMQHLSAMKRTSDYYRHYEPWALSPARTIPFVYLNHSYRISNASPSFQRCPIAGLLCIVES